MRYTVSFAHPLCIALSLIVFPSSMSAQNPRGTLRGVVQDVSGGRGPSANIEVQAAGSSLKRETRSNDHGEFSLSELLPSLYHVTVTAKGFADAQTDVKVVVRSARDMTVTMSPATV